MDTIEQQFMERIASSLDRIATALEARNNRKPGRPPKMPVATALPADVDSIEARLRTAMQTFGKREITMGEMLNACGIQNATMGQKCRMSEIAARCGFKQRRTSKARYYVLP